MSRKLASAFVVAFLLASALCTTVFAHGRTQVGDYELVIGFRNEPAYQGEPNGLDLSVTNTATNEPVIASASWPGRRLYGRYTPNRRR